MKRREFLQQAAVVAAAVLVPVVALGTASPFVRGKRGLAAESVRDRFRTAWPGLTETEISEQLGVLLDQYHQAAKRFPLPDGLA